MVVVEVGMGIFDLRDEERTRFIPACDFVESSFDVMCLGLAMLWIRADFVHFVGQHGLQSLWIYLVLFNCHDSVDVEPSLRKTP